MKLNQIINAGLKELTKERNGRQVIEGTLGMLSESSRAVAKTALVAVIPIFLDDKYLMNSIRFNVYGTLGYAKRFCYGWNGE